MSSAHSKERGVTQADLQQVDIDAEFKSSSSSSSEGSDSEKEDDGPESTPEMLMRAVAVGGDLAKQTIDTWITDEQTGLRYCYSGSERKMYMWNARSQCMYHWHGRGKMDFLWQANQATQNGATQQQQQQQQEGTTIPAAAAVSVHDVGGETGHDVDKVMWITYIPSSYLWGGEKRGAESPEESIEGAEDQTATPDASDSGSGMEPTNKKARTAAADNASVIARCDARVPGFKTFARRWGIDVNILRHFAKHDGMLIRHVIESFKPTKAKAKNALQKYLQGLTKYPQKWRIVAACRQAVLLEEADGETRELVPPRSLVVGSADEDIRKASDDSVTRLVLPDDTGYVASEHFRIFPLGDDFYVQDLGSNYGITVDGMRYRSTDGPIGPLKDGSIVSIGGGSQHNPPMFICEFNTPEELRRRRVEPEGPPDGPTPPDKSTEVEDRASQDSTDKGTEET